MVIGCSDDVFDDVRGEAETLAGLILEITGQFASRNDVVTCRNGLSLPWIWLSFFPFLLCWHQEISSVIEVNLTLYL